HQEPDPTCKTCFGERAPSDAAPVAWGKELNAIGNVLGAVVSGHKAHIGLSGDCYTPQIRATHAKAACKALKSLREYVAAHPEDAPGGPWETFISVSYKLAAELDRDVFQSRVFACVSKHPYVWPGGLYKRWKEALGHLKVEDTPGGPLNTERLARLMASDPDAPVVNLMIDTMEAWILRALDRLRGEGDG
ncbi:hypothetical protein LCGC14_1746820, partial [marine sediment metagenome]